jgi:hypothetical protein
MEACVGGFPSGGPAMSTLAQIYEEHAKECFSSAAREDDPKQRYLLLKLAIAWREDAEALKQGEELLTLASAWRKAKAKRAKGAPSNAAPAPAPRRRHKR